MTTEITDKKIERTFWYYDPQNNFPPECIFDIQSSYQGERLSLAGTKESCELSEYKQKKIIKGWEKILPSLETEFLWIAPKVSQSLFEAISEMPNLRGLSLKHSNITRIPKNGFPKLEFLDIGDSPKVESLEGLERLNNLKWLDMENLKKISDFTKISELTKLTGLSIKGGMYSKQFADSLKPLEKLSELRFLSLTNTKVMDNDLSPLESLKQLELLHIAKWWSKDQFKSLEGNLPNLTIK